MGFKHTLNNGFLCGSIKIRLIVGSDAVLFELKMFISHLCCFKLVETVRLGNWQASDLCIQVFGGNNFVGKIKCYLEAVRF